MVQVRVFLKTELFTPGEDGHVPPGAAILEGKLRETSVVGLTVDVTGYRRRSGAALAGDPRVLLLPLEKIDHVLVVEG